MSRITGHAAALIAKRSATAYAEERERLRESDRVIAADQQALTASLAQAWEQLTVTVVPGLVAEHLDWAASLIHLPSIASAPVQARIEQDRSKLTSELAALDANPDFQDRELKINACTIEIAELERPLAPLREALDPLEAHPMFHPLMVADYGTPNYQTKWYELAYYRHWKHGDSIVEQFGEPRGLTSFAQLRERYEQEAAARRTLETELAKWVSERAHIEAMAVRHAQLQESLRTIEDRHWALTRGRVHEHLSALDDDLLTLLSGYEPGLYAAKRVAGIRAKLRYISAMRATWIAAPLAQLQRRLVKAKRGIDKYQRNKNAHSLFDAHQIQSKYKVPTDGWNKRWNKLDTAYSRVRDYDSYDDYRPGDQTIWWHLMTGGEVKARFIPEVGEYYARPKSEREGSGGGSGDNPREQAMAALIHEGYADPSNDREAWDDVS
ncbi:hypothetical protein DB30_06111 [Enhygromyxa salina]|uniref:Uncharacterized protein n=1 Tax=Enhygromyxa salina TaxID=215803 RepID=A0A0C1ZBI7_9BACT|nr:hypothetical protein [Enhygromyxa salina]KIG15079.1 hypothetical protein DB30_06111 [Enhygromyxa salina]